MNELIRVDVNEKQEQIVSGRALHHFLEIETPYRSWFPRMTEYGFIEGMDYTPYKFVHPQNKQETLNHAIKIEMAKELSMIQRTEKGKQARQYFIAIEKQWNSPESVMARGLQIANQKLIDYQSKVIKLQEKLEIDKPKVIFAEALEVSKSSILVGELAKIIRQNGVDMGQNRLFQWMRDNGYLCKRGENYNLPTQKGMELELFEIKKSLLNNPDGTSRVTRTVKVNGKGQIYFINKIKVTKEDVC